jgi:hypothetical protein
MRFVSGHDFSRAAKVAQGIRALAPEGMFRRNGIESWVLESLEGQMKSVDQGFDPKGSSGFNWPLAYMFFAFGAIFMFSKIWNEAHLRGLNYQIIFLIVLRSLIFVLPLVFSLQFRRYIRSALKENLMSERIAKNCEYWIRNQLTVVYFAIMLFAAWD